MRWILIALYAGSAYVVPGSYTTLPDCYAAAQKQLSACPECRIEYRCKEINK